MNVENLGLSNRSTKALLKTDIKSLRSLLASDINNIKGLGRVSKKEIADLISLIAKSDCTPNDLSGHIFNVMDEQNIFDYIYDLSNAILSLKKDSRLIRIIELHYGLNENEEYPLENLGEGFEPRISKQRVGQLKIIAIETIRKFLLYGYFKVPPKIINEVHELFLLLKESGEVLTEDKIIKIIENHYSIKFTPTKINELRYILALFKFDRLRHYIFGPSIIVYETWVTSDNINEHLLVSTVKKVRDLLRRLIISTRLFDIKIHLNKGQKEKINVSYIEHSLSICKEIELINNEEYVVKFEYLSKIADKAYRILYENKKPMHINDILKEINHRLVKSNNNPNVLIQSLRGEIISDDRFDVVGKSSIYFLKDWDNIVNSFICELIEECLHKNNKSTSFEDIFKYVNEKRHNAKRKTVKSILRSDKKFIKVGNNVFELSEWGSKPYVQDQVIRINEVSRIIKKYFVENDKSVEMITVLKSAIEKEFSIPFSTFYQIARRLPFLNIERKKNTRLLIAHYIENVVIPEKINIYQLQREEVIKRIFEFLKNTDDKVLLKDLRQYVISKTDIKRPTFYKILSEIEEISKEKIGTQYYCKLIQKINQLSLIESEHLTQIENLGDQDIKNELNSIFSLLDSATLDVAFFRLGKVFEGEIKKFLLRMKAKGTNISNNNLATLSNMIEFITNQRIISKTHHLTILREKRNECAHEILSKEDKEKLLKHAPFYIDLFLKYILLFNRL